MNSVMSIRICSVSLTGHSKTSSMFPRLTRAGVEDWIRMEGIVVIDLVYGRGVDLVFCLFLMFVLHSDGSLLFLLLYIILSFLWKERGVSFSFLYLYFYLSF